MQSEALRVNAVLSRVGDRFGRFRSVLRRHMRRLEARRRRLVTGWQDARQIAEGERPRIVLLADRPDWAFSQVATSIARRLRDHFDVRVRYVVDEPDLDPTKVALLYVFYWGEIYHERFDFPSERLIREVASYRWLEERNGGLTPEQLISQHLAGAGTLTTPCRQIWYELRSFHPDVRLCSNAVEFDRFQLKAERTGPLRIGWVGDPQDDTKGLRDILIPATESRFDFIASSGDWSRSRVARFYREIDVLAIASWRESQPLPLMEAMASGCFIVTTDVGIVPEMLEVSDEGIMVIERSTEAFGAAFELCNMNLSEIRSRGRKNAEVIRRSRNWDDLAECFAMLFRDLCARSKTRSV